MWSSVFNKERTMAKTQITSPERFLTRAELAERWSCSVETIKRKTKSGLLHPLRFNERMLRYALSEVLAVEAGAGGVAL